MVKILAIERDPFPLSEAYAKLKLELEKAQNLLSMRSGYPEITVYKPSGSREEAEQMLEEVERKLAKVLQENEWFDNGYRGIPLVVSTDQTTYICRHMTDHNLHIFTCKDEPSLNKTEKEPLTPEFLAGEKQKWEKYCKERNLNPLKPGKTQTVGVK